MRQCITQVIPLLFALVLIGESQVIAQVHKIELGIEGGAGLISIRGNDEIEEYRTLTFGVTGGLTFQFNATKSISLKTGIYYEKKGVKSEAPVLDFRGVALTRLNQLILSYVTVPLLVKWNFGEKRIFYFNGGPYFSYLFEQKDITKSKWVPYEYTSNGSITEYISGGIADYSRFDIGISLGAGANFLISESVYINFELRDNFGLYNISDIEIPNDGTLKNNSLNLLMGIKYGF